MVNHYGGQVTSDLTTMYLLKENYESHKYDCKTNLYLIKHARGEYAHVTKSEMLNSSLNQIQNIVVQDLSIHSNRDGIRQQRWLVKRRK